MKRNTSLDILRSLAILLVLCNHLIPFQKNQTPHLVVKLISGVISVLTLGGWCGVDLFFVLSGFLVSGLIFNEYSQTGKIRPARFLIRRGFKIYPGFIVFIGFTFFIEKIIKFHITGENYPAIDYLKDLLFLHNYLGGRWGITWSLDVEEAFYFLLPVFLLVMIATNKLSVKTLFLTYLFLLLFGIAARQYLNVIYPKYNFDIHYGYTHYRLDALFYGVLLSYLYHHQKSLKAFIGKHQIIIVGVSIILILPNFLFKRELNSWMSVVLLATNPIAFGGLIMPALDSNLPLLSNKLLAYIGKSSYAIYLWHLFLNGYAIKLCSASNSPGHYFVYLAVYFISSIVVGILLTHLVETPFLNLRNRLFPAKINAV